MHINDLSEKEIEKLTPTMKQYIELAKEYDDAVLFYRIGDFYEFFFEFAEKMSRELELALTGKMGGLDEKIPMSGIPATYVDSYIVKLLNLGYKVALCEQIESFENGKKEVLGREVVKVITPGTIISNDMLEQNKANYIMSIYMGEEKYSVAVSDISTGYFLATEFEADFSKVLDEVSKFNPREIIVSSNIKEEEKFLLEELFINIINIKDLDFFDGELSKEYDFVFSLSFLEKDKDDKKEKNKDNEKKQDSKKNKEKIEKENTVFSKLQVSENIKKAIKAIDKYLEITQKIELNQVNTVEIYKANKYMAIDYNSRKNLELNERVQDKRKKGSLYWVLDYTKTAMGSRMLASYINSPLVNKTEIDLRLDSVEEFLNDNSLRMNTRDILKNIYDIERLASKIANGNANARDLNSLKISIGNLVELKLVLSKAKSFLNVRLFNELDILDDVYNLIDERIVEDPPIQITEGGIIKPEFSDELFKLQHIEEINSTKIFELEKEEKAKTKINNLKIKYNRVLGYYIEITKSNIKDIPEDRYALKQSLKNQNRYMTAELKVLEDEILGATEKIKMLEYDIFTETRNLINKEVKRIQKAAKIVATIDTMYSLGEAARQNRYVKPIIENNAKGIIDIKKGRHPVVEKLNKEELFVENDTYLDLFNNTVMIITGPNMSGKSTYMRQVALITLMAQIGSFVPAEYAKIGIVDKIFTRIGASDDLGMGKSTFMVEMSEVSNILKNATSRSLILLDEVGRGTSTYDGMSIAGAVIEEIADKKRIGARTLFATHYHELVSLENKIPSVKNYHVTAEVIGKNVYFLRKVEKGGTNESYGLHVAKLAGIEPRVLKNAEKILAGIEQKEILLEKKSEENDNQFGFSDIQFASIMQKINSLDLNNMTPLDAMNKIKELKDIAKNI